MSAEIRYRMADGSLIYGEFTYVAELEFFDDADTPVDLIRETVEVVKSERVTFRPHWATVMCTICGGEGDDCQHCDGTGEEPRPLENPYPTAAGPQGEKP